MHTLRGWDRREARLRLFGNPKHITPKFASCATSITWRATRPWARQSGARSYAIVDICICRETGERGANPILSKRGKLRTPCRDSWILLVDFFDRKPPRVAAVMCSGLTVNHPTVPRATPFGSKQYGKMAPSEPFSPVSIFQPCRLPAMSWSQL